MARRAIGFGAFASRDVAHDAKEMRVPLVEHLHPAHFDIDRFAVVPFRSALALKRLPAACGLPKVLA